MRRLLIVSYDFPPSAMGIWRTIKFCRYMGDFGWKPAILTVKPVRSIRWDETPLRELPPHTPIRRTESLDQNRIAWVLTQWRKQRRQGDADDEPRANPRPTHGLFRWMMDHFREWVLIPDDRAGWYPFAAAEGRRWLRQTRFDAVYTTSFPHTAHLVGRRLAREFQLPLVADFRDIWIGNYYFYHPATRWHDRIQRRLETGVVQTARAVISVNEPITRDFIERYPNQPRRKFHTITNGFDPADFEHITPRPEPGVFTITYAGTMYGQTSPQWFFQAVRRVLRHTPNWRKVLRLRFVGTMIEPYRAMIGHYALSDITRVDSYLGHGEALQAMADADALLLLVADVPGSRIMLTQKVFEYAAARRPIIGCVPDSAAREFLKQLGEGPVIPPRDVHAIEDAVRSMLTEWERKGRRELGDNPALAEFHRRRLTERLCGVLDETVDRHQRKSR